MFSLTKRSALLAPEAKFRRKEKRGKDPETLVAFTLEELKIDANELGALLREPHAFDALYNTGSNPVEPYLKHLKTLEIGGSIEGAFVRVDVGLNGFTRFDFKACRLEKIKLALRQGGETALSCRVTLAPNMDGKLPALLEFLGRNVQAELRGEAPGAQADLPLNTFTGDAPPPADKPRRGRGRPPGSSAIN